MKESDSTNQHVHTFTLHIYMLFIRLKDLGLGCHIGPIFAGSFRYADDVALVAPTLYAMDKMISL